MIGNRGEGGGGGGGGRRTRRIEIGEEGETRTTTTTDSLVYSYCRCCSLLLVGLLVLGGRSNEEHDCSLLYIHMGLYVVMSMTVSTYPVTASREQEEMVLVLLQLPTCRGGDRQVTLFD